MLRSIVRKTGTILLTVLATSAAAAAQGLTPRQVAVVANSSSEDSLAVARSYAEARGVPAKNVLSLPLPLDEEISRQDYEKLLRQPLRQFLTDAGGGDGGVRCVVLAYGVPLRIAAEGAEPQIRSACRYYLRESRARLEQHLAALGAPPAPREPSLTSTVETQVDDLLRQIDGVLARRLALLAGVADPRKRLAGSRDLLEVYREVHGPRGLIALLERQPIEGAPPAADLRRQVAAAEAVLAQTPASAPSESVARQRLAVLEMAGGLSEACRFARGQSEGLHVPQTDASVDNELAAALWDRYELEGPLPNPLHWRAKNGAKLPPVLMTARIDGPTRGDALRMAKSALAAEKMGLRGRFYIDAGGPNVDYDAHLRRLYDNVRLETRLSAVFEGTTALFAPRSRPEAALYVGWYSPRRYVPSMMWTPGAVAWHIAASEARELHDPQSTRWCPQMIRNGVAATLGATSEPTLGAFPLPEDFFGLLLTGKYTLGECYWRTVGHVSWRMVLLGDPLYNPFAVNPQLDPARLPKGLAPR